MTIIKEKGINPEDIIYQKVLLRTITSSLMEKSYLTNQLILMEQNTKK